MPLFVNLSPSGATLEDVPNGDAALELNLEPQEAEMIGHLLAAESFSISRARAAVYLAGVKEGHKASRRHPVTS